MLGKPAGKKVGGDVEVYSIHLDEKLDRQPLLDLRTRLVLWVLCLLFVGLVYWGLSSYPV